MLLVTRLTRVFNLIIFNLFKFISFSILFQLVFFNFCFKLLSCSIIIALYSNFSFWFEFIILKLFVVLIISSILFTVLAPNIEHIFFNMIWSMSGITNVTLFIILLKYSALLAWALSNNSGFSLWIKKTPFILFALIRLLLVYWSKFL